MDYAVTGKLKKREYCEFILWHNKKFLLAAIILPIIAIAIATQVWELPLYITWIYRGILLKYWAQYFLLVLLIFYGGILLINLLILWKVSPPIEKTYSFTEEGVRVQTTDREARLIWSEANKVVASNRALTLYFPRITNIRIPYRYFDNEQQKQAVVALAQEKVVKKRRKR